MAEFNEEPTKRRSINKAAVSKSDWIRTSEKIKHLYLMLKNVIPNLPEITLTGSSAILVYLISKFLDGAIDQQKMESLMDKLDKVNDIDAVFPGPVYKSKLEAVGFTTSAKVGDVMLEANGIPFHRVFEVLDSNTYETTQVTLQMEVIIEKTLGKKTRLKKTTKTLDVEGNPITFSVVSPSSLLQQYIDQADAPNAKDNRRKQDVLRELMLLETPIKESPQARQNTRPSRIQQPIFDDGENASEESHKPARKVLRF